MVGSKLVSPKVFKYIFLGIGVAVIVASLVFAVWKVFFSSPSVTNQTVNIEYWGIYESEEVMDKLIELYEKENPNIKINYVQKDFDDNLAQYKETLYSRIGSAMGPDIFRIHSTWINPYIDKVSRSNTSMGKAEFNNRFYAVMASGCVTGSGSVLCVPLSYDGLVLVYNADMFNDAGIYNPILQTWDDLRENALKLNQYDSERRYLIRSGAALGTTNNVTNFADIISLMALQSDLDIYSQDFDDNKMIEVIRFYQSFANSRDESVWNQNFPDSVSAFAAQQTAMAFVKSDQILKILEINPTLNFKVVPVPQLPKFGGTLTNQYISSYWVESVSALSSDTVQKEAWKFLEWLSRPEQQITRFNQASIYKKFGEAYGNKKLKDNLINSPLLGPIIKNADDASLSFYIDVSGNDAYVNSMRTLVEEIDGSNNLSDVIKGFKDRYVKLATKKM